MRVIAFRAWFKPSNKMMQIMDIDFSKGSITTSMNGKGGLQDFELMQFTGRKDKLKRELYEGDLLLYKGDKAEIVWEKEKWLLKPKEIFAPGIPLGVTDDKDLELIGNIYEGERPQQ